MGRIETKCKACGGALYGPIESGQHYCSCRHRYGNKQKTKLLSYFVKYYLLDNTTRRLSHEGPMLASVSIISYKTDDAAMLIDKLKNAIMVISPLDVIDVSQIKIVDVMFLKSIKWKQ